MRKPQLFIATGALLLMLCFAVNAGQIGLGKAQRQAPAKDSATVPLHVVFNRPFIDLEFKRPDGSARRARFWVDTGGGGFIMAEPLAKELGVKLGQVFTEGGEKMASAEPPETSLGGMPIDLKGARCFVSIGQKTIMQGVDAEGLFPGHILMRYHVVFDYPDRKFTLAKPGAFKPRGVQIPSPIGKQTGFPRIEMTIGGETFGFLLDTGASYTMISEDLLAKWSEGHKDWKRATGAVGAANMGLGQMEAKGLQLRVAEAKLATFPVGGFAAIARPKGTFETYMSRMMSAPIIGAIGGNVLAAFRVEIDYASGMTYLEKKGAINAFDTDMVGLTLVAKADGSYVVVAVSSQNSKEALDSINPGDRLLKVNKLEVTGQPMAQVIDSLRGKPGDRRALVLERDGKPFTVVAPVVRIL